jgi:hypothetical protein
MKKHENEELWMRYKGSFYAFNTHCKTIKEWLEINPDIKRSWIAEYWYNPVGYEVEVTLD